MIRMCLLPAHIRKLSDWLLFTGRFKSLTFEEEQTAEYILLSSPAWVCEFPGLAKRCSRLIAQRLSPMPGIKERGLTHDNQHCVARSIGAGPDEMNEHGDSDSPRIKVVSEIRVWFERKMYIQFGSKALTNPTRTLAVVTIAYRLPVCHGWVFRKFVHGQPKS
eukprot:s183_g8.t1